jgi:REP element-mobilizing transposase RayT
VLKDSYPLNESFLTSLPITPYNLIMNKQLKLFRESTQTAFGGSLLKNSHAKTKRPWSPKASMHLVLKGSDHKLKYYDRRVEKIIERQACNHLIKIYSLQNVGNHIHLVIKSRTKISLSNFLRAICGLVAKQTKIKWLQRPFTRIVRWGSAYQKLKNYMTINHYESQGYSRPQARFMLEMDLGFIDVQFG